MAIAEIVERLAQLEAKVARLQAKVDPNESIPWWQQISGVFKDDPLFDDAERLGREWRQAQNVDLSEDDVSA